MLYIWLVYNGFMCFVYQYMYEHIYIYTYIYIYIIWYLYMFNISWKGLGEMDRVKHVKILWLLTEANPSLGSCNVSFSEDISNYTRRSVSIIFCQETAWWTIYHDAFNVQEYMDVPIILSNFRWRGWGCRLQRQPGAFSSILCRYLGFVDWFQLSKV